MKIFRWLRITFWGLVALLVVVVSAANHQNVSLSLFPLPYVVDAPGFILFVGIFSLGFSLGGFWMISDQWHTRSLLRKEKQRSGALENEVKGLREIKSPPPLPNPPPQVGRE